ncbi:MAG TPA: MmcQ/YjbR family DNA-binding protein [Ensifer sp.]|nr:MmcQ/YjbR family DNA-binding protein [Ensifer sp.]
MATDNDFERIAMSLPGTEARPHVDRTAYRVRRIYATLAPDRMSANLLFGPIDQKRFCEGRPDAFFPVPNKWGEKGATTVILAVVSEAELREALECAWELHQ